MQLHRGRESRVWSQSEEQGKKSQSPPVCVSSSSSEVKEGENLPVCLVLLWRYQLKRFYVRRQESLCSYYEKEKNPKQAHSRA